MRFKHYLLRLVIRLKPIISTTALLLYFLPLYLIERKKRIKMQIGHKIKKLRELKNLTQEHVATGIGISQGAYSRMELGDSEITYSKLEKIAGVLDMKPEEIIAFNENMVFNVMNNEVGNGLVINNNQLSEGEKNLYIQQIELLKEEVDYLKKLLDTVLSK
jgi:transcriptional regulator with XRE-family HTH domain